VALLATAVDHAVMIAAVRAAGLAPAPATAIGALCGAVVAFALGRRWVFGAAGDAMVAQALRYGVVSALSLGFNVVGEALLVRAGVHYFVARVLVALAVGLGWNFPLQRRWVFVGRAGASSAATATPERAVRFARERPLHAALEAERAFSRAD
jgi:putative flippase GtrA